MITPGYSPTATERVLPKLALDFTTASLDPRVTFTRTTDATHPATYVNSSGLVASATDNQPRFDYNPIALTCKGLLIEESRTNTFQQSNDLSNVYWTKTRCSAGATTTAPDGNNTAYKIVEDSSNNSHLVIRTATTTAASWTLSVFAKAAGRTWIAVANNTVANASAYFDIQNGALGTIGAAASNVTITAYPNSWYRCSITFTATAASNEFRIYLASANNTASYQGDGVSGVYLWGMQLELGAFSTSLIPTTSASLSRNADVATMTGTNFSNWFNNAASSFDVSFIPVGTPTVDNGNFVNFTASGSNANAAYLYSLTNFAYFRVRSGNVTQLTLNLNSSYVFVANQLTKLCAGWNATTLSTLAKDGTVSRSGTDAVLPVGINTVQFGYNVWMQKFNYFPQPFTVSETLAFSK